MERPRLSGALRAFAGVSRPDLMDNGGNFFVPNPSLLADKIQKQRKMEEMKLRENELTWKVLTEQLSKNCQKQDTILVRHVTLN